MTQEITKAQIDPYLNDTFKIHFEDGTIVPLTLIETEDMSKEGLESFGLLFTGPLDKSLPQRTYTLTHHKLGEVVMFLVPVAEKGKDLMCYEALFNRMLDQ